MRPSPSEEVYSVRFSQDSSAFCCALASGVRQYNLEPLAELAAHGPLRFGSIGVCEMLDRSNLLAVVGGGATPRFADNTVLIHDAALDQFVLELTFSAPVLAVRMRRDRLIVALRRQVHVFTFPSPCERLFTVETADNPLGLCEVSPLSTSDHHLLCFPARKTGALQLIDLSATEAQVSCAPVTINAHQGHLAALAINQQGSLVATASRKGTLIRVWDVSQRCLVAELRRGSDTAVLHCIAFSADSIYLCCSSDKGTIHVFAVRDPALNRRSALSRVGLRGRYLESQWALATCTVPAERPCACAFGAAGTVYAVCLDGTFHKYVFTADGSCNREAYDVYLDVCGKNDF
ncbi:WD repeat domain phosphoinositide-interacting protein 4-like [Amphibalanus amphitrite]|uniref:WD repeat domain phosphoinositide-interacting protein 4-like n=1 Tax=Amphibalanus amphitrite TaxID=1232801 RepID=UPI001C916D5B|nr:WD repeat domain phosphoinositide-interacting protein 4-like [Amphibalanus amphitrite]XP_043204206.1 WD repeat domain phosphoinositide-interacting protein 4-like [Amphibalanus amphitrite]